MNTIEFNDNPHFLRLQQFLMAPETPFEMALALGQVDDNREEYGISYYVLRVIHGIMENHETHSGETPPTLVALHSHLLQLEWLLRDPVNLRMPTSFEVLPLTEAWDVAKIRNHNPCSCGKLARK